MRFRTFELVRYGAYADRTFDFGPGGDDGDLHLIVGPNEAGKSTLLSAIGDLLFGFPGRTAQDWLFDYKDLRLRAEIEEGGRTLTVLRRKGNKNTLLGPDNITLPDDLLDPLLGGVDRAGFERMFGLDHAKLRAGGQAILEGRDDAARTLFEAGTGLALVGAELKRLEAQAQALFRPSASNPVVNQLLRERSEALKRVRDTTLSDATLSQLKAREADALVRRSTLIAEAQHISTRMSVLERVVRTRGPLARLDAARTELKTLAAVPDLPEDAQDRLRDARLKRANAREQSAKHQDDFDQANAFITGSTLPVDLLAAQVSIESLEERRPVIEKARDDLTRRTSELDQVDLRIRAARADAGLPPDAPLPPELWRKRVRTHLEACRAVETRAAKHTDDEAEHRQQQSRLQQDRAATPELSGLADLQSAIEQLPPDAEDRLRAAMTSADRLRRRAEESIAALGWTHGMEALARIALPSPEEVVEILARLGNARNGVQAARDQLDQAERDAAEEQRRIELLTAGIELPTREAVDAARADRNEALNVVLERLGSDRQPDDVTAGLKLSDQIDRADSLADRRDSESKRVAEHAVASASLTAAASKAGSASRALAGLTEELSRAEAAWAERARAAQLPKTLLPSGFEAWRAERDRTLKAAEEAEAASNALVHVKATLDDAYARLGQALDKVGVSAPEGYAARLGEARRVAARIEASERAREGLNAREAELKRRFDTLSREADAILRRLRELEAERANLAQEGGLPRSDATTLENALSALEPIASDVIVRSGLARQIEGINRDIRSYTGEVGALLSDLSRPVTVRPTETMRSLTLELKAAVELKRDLSHKKQNAERASAGVKTAQRAISEAEKEIAELVRLAGAPSEAELDSSISASRRAGAARKREQEALHELADTGEGRSLEDLQSEAALLPSEVAAAERETLAVRRGELDSAREDVGRDLAEVKLAIERASSGTDAADAQQVVLETQAALTSAAERHIAVSVQAALLRWMIERHRATTQAPLLARAGELFVAVTNGAYNGLALDYDDDDRAQIVAVRADGTRVGVDGLSEGTRDQLYLALRLGSLQSRSTPPKLPLICDDLLVTADDGRAGLMLSILSEASKNMQVLVFTHHEHLVDVAGKRIGRDAFHLHRMNPVPMTAVA